jgi:hypothetical protein
MNKFNQILGLAIVSIIAVNGQDLQKKPMKYHRSSLHTMIIESPKFPMKDTVIGAFNDAPFPDKYDEHDFGKRVIDLRSFALTEDEKKGLKKSTTPFGALVGKLGASGLTTFASQYGIMIDPQTFELDKDLVPEEIPLMINKYLTKEEVGKKMVAKWFNRQNDGSFDMSLIQSRGEYDATEMAASIATKSSKGRDLIKDAGIELIGNTFLVVNKFKFVSNEIPANMARLVAYMAASQLQSPFDVAARKAADVAYKAASVGYSVYATSFLYKLNWSDSVSNIFYSKHYFDKLNLDLAKKADFDSTKLFKMDYIGTSEAKGLVMIDLKLKAKRPIDVLIKTATIRTIDAVYAQLQKQYDVFMPKTELYTTNPITAKIGMKEGLVGNEKFEVLEMNVDPKTNATSYIRKGIITVDKKSIWDNRYNAGINPDKDETDNTASPDKQTIDRTTFNGSKNYYQGMLIKQIK